MRFTALLLLAALAGALVCAQDATTGPAEGPEDPVSLQSDAPQETTIAAQTPAAAQEPTTQQRQSLLEKGRSDLKNVIEGVKQRAEERIEVAEQRIKDVEEGLRHALKKALDSIGFFG